MVNRECSCREHPGPSDCGCRRKSGRHLAPKPAKPGYGGDHRRGFRVVRRVTETPFSMILDARPPVDVGRRGGNAGCRFLSPHYALRP
jgi:hypothetical protein